MPKKKPMHGLPKVNKELDGLEISINEFGQIETSYDIQKINKFLNREVDDKKLRDRDDITEEGDYNNTYKDEKYWNGPLEEDDDNRDEDTDDEDYFDPSAEEEE